MRYILVLSALFITCIMQSDRKIELPSKIFINKNNCLATVLYDGKFYDFIQEGSEEKRQTVIGWKRNEDLLIMKETLHEDRRRIVKSSVLFVDVLKNVVDTAISIDTKDGKVVNARSVCPSDSILIITSFNYKKAYQDKNNIDRSFDLIIFDVTNKDTIDCLSKFYPVRREYHQSNMESFSPNSNKFVYSVSNSRNRTKEQIKELYSSQFEGYGVYVYEIKSKVRNKIADNGTSPIWSPDGKNIAYILNKKEIWLYNTGDGSSELFYTVPDKHHIIQQHWTPDGKHIYIKLRKLSRFNNSGTMVHKYICLKDKLEQIPSKNIEYGLDLFWK